MNGSMIKRVLQKPAVLLLAVLAVSLSIKLYYLSHLNESNWKERVYSAADTTGQVWWAIQYQRHGIVNRNPDPHPFYSMNDLFLRFHLTQIVYSVFLPEMKDENDLAFQTYKRIVWFLILMGLAVTAIMFLSVKVLTGSLTAGFLAALFYALDMNTGATVFYLYSEPLFTFFSFTGTILLIFALRRDESGRALCLGSGLLFGLATLVRINTLFAMAPALFIVAVHAAVSGFSLGTLRKLAVKYLLWTVGFLAMLGIRFYQIHAFTGQTFFALNGIYSTEVVANIEANSQARRRTSALI